MRGLLYEPFFADVSASLVMERGACAATGTIAEEALRPGGPFIVCG